MDPLTIAGLGLGANIVGSIFGGGGTEDATPQWLIDELMKEYNADRMSGFLVPEETFTKKTQSDIDSILAGLPVAEEEFNADLASRGLFSAGEAPKAMYRDVYAPIAKSAMSTALTGRLSYAQMKSQAAMANSQMRVQLLSQLLDAVTRRREKNVNPVWDTLSELGATGFTFGVGSELGLFE